MQMVGSREVRESIVKSQRRDKTPRSENYEVVSTLAIAILHVARKGGYFLRGIFTFNTVPFFAYFSDGS